MKYVVFGEAAQDLATSEAYYNEKADGLGKTFVLNFLGTMQYITNRWHGRLFSRILVAATFRAFLITSSTKSATITFESSPSVIKDNGPTIGSIATSLSRYYRSFFKPASWRAFSYLNRAKLRIPQKALTTSPTNLEIPSQKT